MSLNAAPYSPLGATSISLSGCGMPKLGVLFPLNSIFCAMVNLSSPHDPAGLTVAWKAFFNP